MHTLFEKLSRFRLHSAHSYYIIILAIIGGAFVFIVPPFQAPDEQTHIYRAYQLSEGRLIAQKLSYGAGDVLPASLSQSYDNFRYIMFKPEEKLNISTLKTELKRPLNQNDVIETRFENTAPYPPISYFPQIIGISVGKLFSASPVVLLYLARLANLVAWLLIIYFCMKRQSRIALPLFAFALLPIVLFQSASASADVITAGASIFFAFEVLRVATSKTKITKNDKIILLAAGMVLALCKLPYILLVLLVFLLPKSIFSTAKNYWKWIFSFIAIPGIIAAAWLAVAYKSFVNLQEVADAPAQLSHILHHPLSYVHTLFNTYLTEPSDGLYIQMIGQLGWLDTKLTFWSMLLAFTAIVLATIGVVATKSSAIPSTRQRLTALGIGLTIIGAISSLLYLTWTAVGAPVVSGLQGRYYIPLIGLLTIVFIGLLGATAKQGKRIAIMVYCLLTCTTVATLITLLMRYHSL